MALTNSKKDPRGKPKKRSGPSPPTRRLNLDAVAAENVTGEETTWGKVGLRCRAEVEVDPPLWLSGLEEEVHWSMKLECEEAPLARRSSGSTSSLLMLFA
jgi:hypothetical protein